MSSVALHRRGSAFVFALPVVLVTSIAAVLSQENTPRGGISRLFGREDTTVVRVMTWNVGGNSIFPSASAAPAGAPDDSAARFARVVRSVQPDVLCLQEVTREAASIATLVSSILSPGRGRRWHAHQVFDNTLISRFSLTLRGGRVFVKGTLRRGHAAALIRLPDTQYPHDLYAVCAHFQSKAGSAQMELRQLQADALAAWLRDAKRPGGAITLPQRTPFLVMGDLNVIDTPSLSLATLLSWEIVDHARFGASSKPDWNDSPLTDLMPTHNAAGVDTYTWRDDTEPFPPGALDRVLYTDSVLQVARSYVLDTTAMTPNELTEAGLQANDVMRDPARGIHDHLPVVADFVVLR